MSIPAQSIRTALVEQAALFLDGRSADEVARFRERVTEVVDSAGDEELARIAERIRTTGKDWGYHAPEPFVRKIHWIMADFALSPDSALEGAELLARTGPQRPLVFLSNHLSYADAHVVEILLHRAGMDDLASRLTVLAGPKVYSELFRRFSSLCFGTIKTPQSTARSSGEAVMPAREVARIARETIDVAFRRQQSGDSLLIFVEGTRSRGGGMQRALPAVSRYFECPGALLVPVSIRGSEQLLPVDKETVQRATVTVRIGRPIAAERVAELCRHSRRCIVDVVGLQIAKLLPSQYQGAYGPTAEDLDEPRRVTAQLEQDDGS